MVDKTAWQTFTIDDDEKLVAEKQETNRALVEKWRTQYQKWLHENETLKARVKQLARLQDAQKQVFAQKLSLLGIS